MIIFQYAYYRMVEWDKRMWKGKYKSWMIPTDVKAVIVFGVVELWIALALYCIVGQIIRGGPVLNPPKPILIIILSVYSISITVFNQLMLGPESRARHYRKIFEAWDKKKRMRWNLYLVLILVLSFAACFFTSTHNASMLRLENKTPHTSCDYISGQLPLA